MRFVIAATALVTTLGLGTPAAASQEPPPPPPPPPTVAAPQSDRGAVSRDSAVPRVERAPAPAPAGAASEGTNIRRERAPRAPAPAVSAPPAANTEEQGAQRRGAVRRPPESAPSGGRPGGGQGPATRDRAVLRTEAPPDRDGGRSRVYYYPDYWSYGRYYDPYYYSGFHLGYLAYSPWGWTPAFYGYPYGGSYGYGGVYRAHGYDIGSVKLKVQPRDAEVYVDGYFAGHVDEFDGVFQALRLDSGGYRIEIRKPGYETLQLDVRIQPGRTLTFRGELKAAP